MNYFHTLLHMGHMETKEMEMETETEMEMETGNGRCKCTTEAFLSEYSIAVTYTVQKNEIVQAGLYLR